MIVVAEGCEFVALCARLRQQCGTCGTSSKEGVFFFFFFFPTAILCTTNNSIVESHENSSLEMPHFQKNHASFDTF
jgi:hypothetical protein